MTLKYTLLTVEPAAPLITEDAPVSEAVAARARLTAACTAAGVAQVSVPAGSITVPPGIEPGSAIIIAGAVAAEQLRSLCLFARANGHHVILASDAIEFVAGDAFDTLVELNELLFQLSPAAAVKSLVTGKVKFVYAFPKADCTSTVCILLDGGKSVVVIKRKHDPYKGMFALPGGFLNIQLEDLPTCASRETSEETNIKVTADELELVDVRSKPSRDNRGHVVDHGYMWLVPAGEEARVRAELTAGDDAEDFAVAAVADLMAEGLAFDHMELLQAALKRIS